MSDRVPPMVPHISHHVYQSNKTTRAIRILFTLTVILFLGYYEIRGYYIKNIAPPANTSMLQEFQGSYCCGCEDVSGYLAMKKTIKITAQPFLLPVPEFSLKPFSISMPLQPPDGSFTQTDSKKVAAYHMYPGLYQPSVGYFYASNKQFELISDGERLTLVPIRWGETKFLVEPERIDAFCRGPVVSTPCYYSTAIRSHSLQGDPVYPDGTPVCQ